MTTDLEGLFSQLDFDEPEVDNFYEMDLVDLNMLIRSMDQELMSRGELLHQTSERGREIHSRRGAAMVVMKKRMLGT